MSLSYDTARCNGVGSDEDGWREGCEDCQRRTSPGNPYRQIHMTPPEIVVFECARRIPAEYDRKEKP